ncbi:MAG TPA: flagellar hook-length control protein FliK [Treponemataceae bacterium]|nr:flagellar hook-length control protein FliK [Treponemataceae bacterium]
MNGTMAPLILPEIQTHAACSQSKNVHASSLDQKSDVSFQSYLDKEIAAAKEQKSYEAKKEIEQSIQKDVETAKADEKAVAQSEKTENDCTQTNTQNDTIDEIVIEKTAEIDQDDIKKETQHTQKNTTTTMLANQKGIEHVEKKQTRDTNEKQLIKGKETAVKTEKNTDTNKETASKNLHINAQLLKEADIEEKADKNIQVDKKHTTTTKTEYANEEALLFSQTNTQNEQNRENANVTNAEVFIANDSDVQKSKTKKLGADEPLIKVIDERTTVTQLEKSAEKRTGTIKSDSNKNVQMTLDLAGRNTPQNNVQGQVLADGATKNNFSQMLSEHLQKNTQEFVKAGTIALKDNDTGTIDLLLNPNDLGNVKIKLEISDNILKGKIIVATKEAYNAFQESLSSLKQAFNASGFDTSSFDLAWTGSDASQSFAGNSEKEQSNKNPFAPYYEEGLADLEEFVESELSYNGSERMYIDITA